MTILDDDRLALVLTSVGDHLLIDDDDPAAPTAVTAHRRRHRHRGVLAAVAAAVVAAVLVGIPPVRTAVAGWLGIGSTRIVVAPGGPASDREQPTPASTEPSIAAGLPPLDTAEAAERLDRPLPELDGTLLGPPSGYAEPRDGGVLVIWPGGATLWIHEAQAGVGVITEKYVATADVIELLDGLGDDALLVTGDHTLRTPDRTVAATTVVIWVTGQWELRLEADHDPAELIEIARTIDQSF